MNLDSPVLYSLHLYVPGILGAYGVAALLPPGERQVGKSLGDFRAAIQRMEVGGCIAWQCFGRGLCRASKPRSPGLSRASGCSVPPGHWG